MRLRNFLKRMAEVVVRDLEGANVNIVGLGSGSAVAAFVRALGDYVKHHRIGISVIPSSIQIQLIAERFGLNICSHHLIPFIDLVVDGADQIDRQFRMIKGGGGALFKEKILLNSAKRRFILVDESKFTESLNKPVPIEVHPFARTVIERSLKSMGGIPKLRLREKGYPFITDNGNLILDTNFGEISQPKELELKIKALPGVIEVGIFTCKIDRVYKVSKDGYVERIDVNL
ncbi:MAG: ribose-5-phosphate isomerase RpiA [Nitrososphaerota archaeon]|nr:ribose-5-phosphate isomerase RpiA [Nitrososphaerales archaeon]MCX8191561.1 ribose-5-phosphate isomerase RpiA [Nitrososphaerales archaeon]MDW8044797.1 ribose-5-phosphate isomerase RpiA [Nitrososphaerota archaeon]